jgi:signal transduction histidine kinase
MEQDFVSTSVDRGIMRGITEGLKQFQRTIFLTTKDLPLQDLLFLYTLKITFLLSFASLFINPYVGLSPLIIKANQGIFLLLFLFYWLARFKKQLKNVRRFFNFFVLFMINVLWIQTEGSSGPSIIFIMGYLPLYIFFSEDKFVKYGLVVVSINLFLLFLVEILQPDLIIPYPSKVQRSSDIFMVVTIFLIFEIPLILYIKRAIIREKEQAKQSEVMKTSYIVDMSHEIRTPMNAILGFSELLAINDLDKKEQKHYINIINDNGRMLLNLLNNIISISKIESQKTKLAPTWIVPNELLNQIYNTLIPKSDQLTKVDFKVVTPLKESAEKIFSDEVMLYQIISNLAYNALKFTPEGFVHMGYDSNDSHITFWVKDSGIGISKEKQKEVFKRFKQADKLGTGNNLHGSGLGLSICKSLSNLLKGEMYFTSEPGNGSAFYLKLPLKHPESA